MVWWPTRTHEAGQLIVMHDIGVTMTVPPNTPEFVVTAHCSSGCTSRELGTDGISVFNVLLHSHLSGRKLKLRHFRDGVELPWIDYDDHYDFDYQQNKNLGEIVQVLPGDHLTYGSLILNWISSSVQTTDSKKMKFDTECTYDSTWNGGRVVTGGLSTRNEMCEAFLWYYPKLDDLIYCGSSYKLNESFIDFNITKWDFVWVFTCSDYETRSNFIIWLQYTRGGGPTTIYHIEEPEYLRGDFETSMSYNFTWTEGFKKQLEEKRRFGNHDVICGDPGNYEEGISVSYPDEFTEYLPETFCNNSD